MAWVWLFLGGVSEVVWAYGLKASEGFTKPAVSVITIIFMIISFYLFAKSMQIIPIGTGYAIFTGLGAAGTVIAGVFLFEETMGPMKVIFLLLLFVGIIGLKVTTKEGQEVSGEEE
ncbi:quaternary ammonium compound efflux SMR transporter SugE1 [Bacillus carboniphilus]|uniref:Quaternary ammonium compound efflux SMR transporter SugE1 n=1 Tax=Bacillus carboniphilus TaxID=86663 RepID=A0ABN0W0T0_9BACI